MPLSARSLRAGVLPPSKVVAILAQTVFTVEAAVKILACAWKPLRYFDDAWNKLDFFIVVVGFVEMSPASFIFELFPVVILRLLWGPISTFCGFVGPWSAREGGPKPISNWPGGS